MNTEEIDCYIGHYEQIKLTMLFSGPIPRSLQWVYSVLESRQEVEMETGESVVRGSLFVKNSMYHES